MFCFTRLHRNGSFTSARALCSGDSAYGAVSIWSFVFLTVILTTTLRSQTYTHSQKTRKRSQDITAIPRAHVVPTDTTTKKPHPPQTVPISRKNGLPLVWPLEKRPAWRALKPNDPCNVCLSFSLWPSAFDALHTTAGTHLAPGGRENSERKGMPRRKMMGRATKKGTRGRR